MPLIPPIDYTNKDFASLRQAMLDLARYRLPEWTDQSPADLGMLLVDLFAYMGDVVLYYQDRIANESFLGTASERRSVLLLLRLIGYELRPPVTASTGLTLVFKPLPSGAITTTVMVPNGAQFATKGSPVVTFEYLGPDLTIDLASDQVQPGASGKLVYTALSVRQSRAVPTEVIGSSTGEPNQSFTLSQSPVILDTLVVEVNEGSGWVVWDRRDSLFFDTGADGVTFSGPAARDYYLQFDENDVASVFFGDGVYGRRPPVGGNNVRATYRVGGGASGNVPAGAIVDARTTLTLSGTSTAALDSVTNPSPAAGGSDHEDVDHAVRFGPLAFRSGQRAVTLSDYVALAQQAGGVAKVRARGVGWNRVELYVAPEGDVLTPTPENLRRALIAYFEDKRMVGTFVDVLDPTPVPIDIAVSVVPDRRYVPSAVQQGVDAAVRDLLAFKNVDFGKPVYLSDVYAKAEAVPGVLAVTVMLFRRHDSPALAFEEQLAQYHLPGLAELPAFLRNAIRVDVTAGSIDLGEFEIPVLGDFAVTLQEAPR